MPSVPGCIGMSRKDIFSSGAAGRLTCRLVAFPTMPSSKRPRISCESDFTAHPPLACRARMKLITVLAMRCTA